MGVRLSVIAITGIAGYVAQRVLARLEMDPAVQRVIGVDVSRSPHGSPKLEYHEMDIRDPRMREVFADADVILHLVSPDDLRDGDEMRSVHLDGTRAVVSAAVVNRIGAVIYLSSGIVYGAHADNPVPLTERVEPRPNEDFPPATLRWKVERLLTRFGDEHRSRVTILRAATVLGANTENFVSRMLEAPGLTTVKGFEPPLQFVHEEDVADALVHALGSGPSGTYNLASDGWLSAAEVTEITRKRRVELPEPVAFAMADRLWRAGLTAAPAGELHYVMHPWVMDGGSLRAAGWRPRYSNRDALLEALEAHRNWIALGRARVRKDSLAKGAAATLGAIGAMALVRRARRRPD